MAAILRSSLFWFLVSLSGWSLTVNATSYQDCGSEGEVIEVLVTDCDIPPCIVYRPNNYSIAITFVAPKDAVTLNTEIIATVSGSVEVPWPAPSACGLLGDLSCPILQGETYPFDMTMQVMPEYPAIEVMVRVQLVDEDEVKHACVEMPMTVA